MFKFKKIVSLFLALVLTLGTASSAFAADDRVSLGNMEISGVGMTPTEFEDAFATSVKSTINPADYAAATLNLTGIIYSGDELTMNATLTTADNTAVEFEFGGKLYDGYKQETFGTDSFIVDAESSNAEVQSLLFEVVTNDQDTDALIDATLSGVANIKVYVKYNGLVYMFESAIPNGFSVIANGEYEKMTAPEKDMLWFSAIISGNITEQNVDSAIELYSMTKIWQSKIYTHTFEVAGRTYRQNISPIGYVNYESIQHATTPWTAGFGVRVVTQINGGSSRTDIDSVIKFRNVTISLVGDADTTEFTSWQNNGRVKSISHNGNEVTSRICNLLRTLASVKVNATMDALSILTAIHYNYIDFEFGNPYEGIEQGGAYAVKAAAPQNTEMYVNSFNASTQQIDPESPSHYMLFQADVRSTVPRGGSSQYVQGCAVFGWSAYLDPENTYIGGENQAYKVTFNYYAEY